MKNNLFYNFSFGNINSKPSNNSETLSQILYGEKFGIPAPVSKKSPYSIDVNLLGRSIEAGLLEDPMQEPNEDVFAVVFLTSGVTFLFLKNLIKPDTTFLVADVTGTFDVF